MQESGSTHAVVLAADSGFAMQLSVALASLARQVTSAASSALDAYVLTADIAAEERRGIEASVLPAIDIHWVDVDRRWGAGLRMADYLSLTSAFRLMIGEAVPSSVERVVYMDADVLVRRPIDELFTCDLGGAAIAGVPDAGHPWITTVHALPWRALGLDPSAPYFNAGVLVVDVARWRDGEIGSRAMELLRDHKFAYSDQCALNAVADGSFGTIETRFNVQADHFLPKDDGLVRIALPETDRLATIGDPTIVHFCNGGARPSRPWFVGSPHPFAEAWLEVRSTTPYARASLQHPPTLTRADIARRRLRRAAYMLARG